MKNYTDPQIVFEAIDISDFITTSFATEDENGGDIQSFGNLVQRN